MQFKTFTSYDTQDLDNQLNEWFNLAFDQRLQVLDVKSHSCFAMDNKAYFVVSVIYQHVPEKKEIPNPCCNPESNCEQKPVEAPSA